MRFKKPKFWDYKKISFWSIILIPFSILYQLVLWIRILISIFKKNKGKYPIICVGNIYLGGTGKTPLAIEIFKLLKSDGKNPAFIKKNYSYLKDEIKMMSEIGTIYNLSNRVSAIALSESEGHDVTILDDGYQDFSIHPNFSILCFNSKQLIGNGLLIPAGPLREKLSAVLRADCIIINGKKDEKTSIFENQILKKKKLHFFYSKYKIKNIEKFHNKEITAFAGIGNPSNFFDLLEYNNLNVKKTYSFPDHHNYSEEDFEKIIGNKSTKLVTTKKDYYRMTDQQKKNCDFIEVDLEIENKEKFYSLIKNYL